MTLWAGNGSCQSAWPRAAQARASALVAAVMRIASEGREGRVRASPRAGRSPARARPPDYSSRSPAPAQAPSRRTRTADDRDEDKRATERGCRSGEPIMGRISGTDRDGAIEELEGPEH